MTSETPIPEDSSLNDHGEVPASEGQVSNQNGKEGLGSDFSNSINSDQTEGSDDSVISSDKDVQPVKEETVGSADTETRLQQLENEHETLKSQYMRIAADFDNFRKRQTRDQDDLRIQLTCTTLSEILPVVDNFERARQQLKPEGDEAQALHRSYQGLYKQLVDVFKQLGVAPMRVVGQSFDPNLHEAVLREPSQEYLEDIVIEELQRGYHLDGRVLRHALVKVSMGPGPSTENKEIIEEQNNASPESPKEEDLNHE